MARVDAPSRTSTGGQFTLGAAPVTVCRDVPDEPAKKFEMLQDEAVGSGAGAGVGVDPGAGAFDPPKPPSEQPPPSNAKTSVATDVIPANTPPVRNCRPVPGIPPPLIVALPQ
jgi:hypothetical protein